MPPPAHNPFANFAPPPDSPAARLHLGDTAETGSAQPPLHAGWGVVANGLGSLRQSAMVGLAAAFLGGFVSAASTVDAPLLVYAILGCFLLAALVALVFHVIGLVRCLKMPLPEEGGSGRGLVLTALILTGAGVLLAPCGIGALALVALPFVLGVFLRGIGRTLANRPTVGAAGRYMIASGAAILAGIVVPVAMMVIAPVMLSSGAGLNAVLVLSLVLSLAIAGVNVLAVLAYLSALGHAERAVRSAVRSRGTTAPPPRSTREPEPVDEDTPTPRPVSRPSRAKSKRAAGDDYNPFA